MFQSFFRLIVTVPVVLFGLCAVAQAEITLSYSCFFPPMHIQSQLAEQWCREIEARTHGKVKINYYPGGTLTSPKQCFDGVIDGISDIGMSASAYTRGRFPIMTAIDLPLGYTSGVQATRVANHIYKQFRPKEFRDVKVMYFHAHGPGLLFSKRTPITRLEDLQGMKIRATGNSAKLIKALGGSPVAQPMAAAYQSLQKGVVDGSIHPIESNKGWKLAEVVKFGTDSKSVGYTTSFYVVMNKDKWNKLDAATQAIFIELNQQWAIKHGQAWDKADAIGRQFFLDQGGVCTHLTPPEANRWTQAAIPVITEYQELLAHKSIDGKTLIQTIKKIMQQQPTLRHAKQQAQTRQ